MKQHDYDTEPVEFCDDSIESQAPYVDWGVLVEYCQDGIYVYTEGVTEETMINMLERVLKALRG